MGKYTAVTKDLPRLPGEAGFQTKVDEAKVKVGSRGPGGLADRYRQLRDRKDRVDALVAKLNVQVAAVEQLMWSAFEDAGLTSVRLSDGTAVDTQVEPYASVKDPVALRRWVEGTKLVASLALPWQTLNADVKERLVTGQPLPPGVDVYVRTKTVLRRARG